MSGKSGLTGENLHRGLQERHMQLIAIGGAIGVGLFLGSGSAIKTAGPSLILTYLLGGVVIYFMMRALGEIAVQYPVAGSFSAYANHFLGPQWGYITGWTYWFMWITTGMAEITAVGVYCTYWWPWMPQWIPALASLVLMTGINLVAVKAYGEVEFWFALIKVVVIVVMIVIGTGIILFGIGNNGVATGISNLYSLPGGFFPNGLTGMALAMGMVMFAFNGVELVGVTAGEAADPERSIPGAIKKIMWRILIFYVGALVVIMSIYPWNQLTGGGSPFVMVFQGLGIASAAGIINFVVLTAACSSCNSGIFSNGRMLYNLALQGRAPTYFSKVSSNKVPARGIVCSAFVMLIGVLLNYKLPGQVFLIVTSLGAFAAVWVWGTILVIQMISRKGMTPAQVAALKFPMLFYPWGNYIALAGFLGVLVLLAINPDTRIAMIVGPLWLAALFVVYRLCGWHKADKKLEG